MTGVEDKDGQPIEPGDRVWTRMRGGKREGEVEAILESNKDVEQAGDIGVVVKNTPKVIFTDQHDHKVAHNPGTLEHAE